MPVTPIDGRSNRGITELRLRIENGGFIADDRRLELGHRRRLVCDLLFRRISLLRQWDETPKVRLRVGEVCLVACQVRFSLLKRCLEGARVELCDKTAGMHGLAFDKAYLVNRAGNLGVDVHDIVRHHGADTRPYQGYVGDLDLFCNHGYGRRWRLRLRRWARTLDAPRRHANATDRGAETDNNDAFFH